MTRPRGLWLALGVVGMVVLVAFDTPLTLTIGILCLLSFVAAGVALIATPEFLTSETDVDDADVDAPSEPGRERL